MGWRTRLPPVRCAPRTTSERSRKLHDRAVLIGECPPYHVEGRLGLRQICAEGQRNSCTPLFPTSPSRPPCRSLPPPGSLIAPLPYGRLVLRASATRVHCCTV